jgi:NAD+ synthase
MKSAGAKGLVCGISGGLDSSVVAALIKKAAPDNHLCLILPCYSLASDIKDAQLAAKNFKLKTKTIHLCAVYDSLLKILPDASRLAKANLKARLRMLALYYFANKLNYLVVGTGNKSELMCGYFTKFGDGGVDLLPLGGLLKRDVRAIAGRLAVPQAIIDKPPSAGLWIGQTDEGEMGVTYQELDAILEGLEKNRKADMPAALVDKVKEKMRLSKHKRNMAEIFDKEKQK